MKARVLKALGVALMIGSGIIMISFLAPAIGITISGIDSPGRLWAVSLVCILCFAGLFFIGWRLFRYAQSDGAAKQRPVESPAENMAQLKKRLALPDGLEIAGNPWRLVLDTVGPDGLSDRSGVKLWLRVQNGADALDTLRALIEWLEHFDEREEALKGAYEREWRRLISPSGYRYVVLTEDEHALDGRQEAARSLCGDKDIWYAIIRGRNLINLITGKEYTLWTSEWPGSADDAATYGEWELIEANKRGARAH